MVNKKPFCFDPDFPYTIFCEGMDERQWLIYYLDYLRPKYSLPDRFLVHDLGGNEQLLNAIFNIPKLDHYSTAQAILFIRDAEKDHHQAIQALSNRISASFSFENLTSSALQPLSCGIWYKTVNGTRIGFMLFPGKNTQGDFDNGTLEDLCLSILKTQKGEISANKLQQLGTQYIDAITMCGHAPFRTLHKNKLHAYFSGTDRFVGMKIGEAAKAGCFDFSHPKLDALKDMLIAMCQGE